MYNGESTTYLLSGIRRTTMRSFKRQRMRCVRVSVCHLTRIWLIVAIWQRWAYSAWQYFSTVCTESHHIEQEAQIMPPKPTNQDICCIYHLINLCLPYSQSMRLYGVRCLISLLFLFVISLRFALCWHVLRVYIHTSQCVCWTKRDEHFNRNIVFLYKFCDINKYAQPHTW